MKIFGLTLAGILLCAECIAASGPSAADAMDMASAGTIMTFYYKDPQPGRLIEVLKFVLSQESLVSRPSFRSIGHFFAAAAKDNKEVMDGLKRLKDNCPGSHKKIVLSIINEAKDFRSPEPTSPLNLDCLWSEFMATGSVEPVKKIISVLGLPDSPSDILLIGAAEWSLASNAEQHGAVYDIIEKEAVSATGQMKARIDRLTERVKKAKKGAM